MQFLNPRSIQDSENSNNLRIIFGSVEHPSTLCKVYGFDPEEAQARAQAIIDALNVVGPREAFLNLVADADSFAEEIDGDGLSDIDYTLGFRGPSLDELVDVLRIPRAIGNTPKDDIDSFIAKGQG